MKVSWRKKNYKLTWVLLWAGNSLFLYLGPLHSCIKHLKWICEWGGCSMFIVSVDFGGPGLPGVEPGERLVRCCAGGDGRKGQRQ